MQNRPSANIQNDALTFYDAVAPEYNKEMSSDTSNSEVRAKIAKYFNENVKDGHILDFGGGTGLDLPWLLEQNFTVSFCEPSEKMRAIAVDLNASQLKTNHLMILNEKQLDFTQWTTETFPVKFDAVLANFGVVNSIGDLELLLEKTSMILKPGGHVIANMLDTTYNGIFKFYIRNFLKAVVTNTPPVMITQFKGTPHTSFLHTPNKIRNLSAPCFSCKRIEQIGGFGFMLVHLQKNR